MPYRTLNPDQLVKTLERLELRIAERFPGAGLTRVCAELLELARGSKARVERIAKPNISLRIGIASVLIMGIVFLAYVGTIIEVKRDAENLFGVLEGIDAAVNILIVTGAGIYFLTSLEGRWAQQMAMHDLHELRSIVHVIDMHQLTKDPARASTVASNTASSPERTLTPYELGRYLDYCSELLSLAAKISALYAQGTRDSLVVETASDLGQITSNMSGKIWQKITLTQKLIDEQQPAAAFPVPKARDGARAS